MKKFTVLVVLFTWIFVLVNTTCFAETTSAADLTKSNIIKEHILDNIYSISMNFQGENANWAATLLVENIATKNEGIKTQAKLKLVPKNNDVKFINYSVITSNGVIKDNVWQIFTSPIEKVFSEPIPKIDDSVVIWIQAKDSSKGDILVLKNVIPEGMITPTKAVEIFVDYYYNVFKKYPEETFTYKLESYKGDWLITYDDNDNIGGQAIMAINGKTGTPQGIRVDEE